jgi:hypothetical protein
MVFPLALYGSPAYANDRKTGTGSAQISPGIGFQAMELYLLVLTGFTITNESVLGQQYGRLEHTVRDGLSTTTQRKP